MLDDIKDKIPIDADNYYNGTLDELDYTKSLELYSKALSNSNK